MFPASPATEQERVSRKQANPECIRRNFAADFNAHVADLREDLGAERLAFTYENHFLQNPVQRENRVSLKDFYDQLTPFSRFSSTRTKGLLDFLETFVQAVKTHNVADHQAITRFLSQLDGDMKREIQADILGSSLQEAINRLFQIKCKRPSTSSISRLRIFEVKSTISKGAVPSLPE